MSQTSNATIEYHQPPAAQPMLSNDAGEDLPETDNLVNGVSMHRSSEPAGASELIGGKQGDAPEIPNGKQEVRGIWRLSISNQLTPIQCQCYPIALPSTIKLLWLDRGTSASNNAPDSCSHACLDSTICHHLAGFLHWAQSVYLTSELRPGKSHWQSNCIAGQWGCHQTNSWWESFNSIASKNSWATCTVKVWQYLYCVCN